MKDSSDLFIGAGAYALVTSLMLFLNNSICKSAFQQLIIGITFIVMAFIMDIYGKKENEKS